MDAFSLLFVSLPGNEPWGGLCPSNFQFCSLFQCVLGVHEKINSILKLSSLELSTQLCFLELCRICCIRNAYGFRITRIPINPLTRLFGAPDCVPCRLLLANFLFWSAVFNELPDVQAPKQMKVATPRCPAVARAQIQTGRALLLHLQHVERCCVHRWTYFFDKSSFWCSAASLRRAPGSFRVLHCAVKRCGTSMRQTSSPPHRN